MSGLIVEKLTDLPIVLQTVLSDWDYARDMAEMDSRTRVLLDSAEQPVYLITNLLQMPPFRFEDLLSATSQITKGGNAALHHPKLLEFIVVSTNTVFKLATQGLNNPVFGNVKAATFETMEDALAYVRSKTAS